MTYAPGAHAPVAMQQAPAIGRIIAEELVLGRAQSINIDRLRITRFATARQSQERNII